MKGFDPKFRDFPDDIIGITNETREDRGIARLRREFTLIDETAIWKQIVLHRGTL